MNELFNQEIEFYKSTDTFTKIFPFKIFKNDDTEQQVVHTHDYIQMWYVAKGGCVHHLNSQSYTLKKGDLFVLPPLVEHYLTFDETQEMLLIGCEFSEKFINEELSGLNSKALFDFAYLEPFFVSANLIKPSFSLMEHTSSKVEGLLSEMLTEYDLDDKFSPLYLKASLLKLLAILGREYESSVSKEHCDLLEKYEEAMNVALKHIDEHVTQKISLEEICSIALMSPTSFSYIFKQKTGKTFTEYLQYKRINHAISLFSLGGKTISEVCFESGFNDNAYFNRVFKKMTGLTPSQYKGIYKNNL